MGIINKRMKRFRSFDDILREHTHILETSVANVDPDDLPKSKLEGNERPEDQEEVDALNRRCSRVVQKSKYAIGKASPTIGIFLSKCAIVLTYEVGTMAVDRKMNIYINPKFSSKLTELENVGVIVHEVLHIINSTFYRQRTRNHEWWNIATDYVMNLRILKDGLKLPDGCCKPEFIQDPDDEEGGQKAMVYLDVLDEKTMQPVRHEWNIEGKSAEWLYAQFMKVLKEKPPGPGGGEYEPKVGDIIFNKQTSEYGEIEQVEPNISVEKISKEEAQRRILAKG